MPVEVLVVDWRPAEFDGVQERFPEIHLHTARTWAEADEHLGTADVLVTVGHGFVPEVADRMPRLKWMQSMISGTDFARRGLANRADVLVTSARGIHGAEMTEAALFHMLCLARNARRSVRAHDERRWDSWDPHVLDGATVGIVGIGVVGSHLARALGALGMTVVGVSRTARAVPGIEKMVGRADLTRVAPELDYLVLTVPLDKETHHLVDASVLDAMKPTAFLLNLARGGVVDTAALIEALRRDSIAGAGLDTFEEEPLPSDNPLWTLENVFITAHMGGRSDRYARLVLRIFEPNLRRFLDGDLDSMVNVVER
jgi:phosphoglycerate dehydrogenase-like enzyme